MGIRCHVFVAVPSKSTYNINILKNNVKNYMSYGRRETHNEK